MGTIAKALDLLDLFTATRPGIGLSEMARLSGVNKATCHRLLGELCARGLLEQAAGTRDYRLGPAVLRLAALREAHVPMREAAQPVVAGLARETGETAHLSMLMGGMLRPLLHAYSPAHSTKVMLEDTDSLPLHATASGLAVLSALPEAQVAAVLAGPLPALTPWTLTDPGRLRAIVQEVRMRGHAESLGGFQPDVHSLAVPLFGADGACAGALAVAAPAPRMTDTARRLIRDELVRSARTVTAHWGGVPPADFAARWRQTA